MGEAIDVVGRSTELSRMNAWFAGPPGALLLVGEPGIGKSTLWRSGVNLAMERNHRALIARPTEAESRAAFTSLADLLDDIESGDLAELPELQRQALELAAGRSGSVGVTVEQRLVGLGLLSAMRSLARRGPVVVAIDDVQWLDAATRWVVRFAARRLDAADPVRLLLAQRSASAATLVSDLEGEIDLERVELGGVSIGALDRIIRVQLGDGLARPLLLRVHGTANGNPLYGLELARAIAACGSKVKSVESLPVPPTLQAMIGARLRRRATDDERVLLAVAALADPSEEVLERALGEVVAPALANAVREGVIEAEGGRLRFAHPLFASAVYDSAHVDARRAVHARLADALGDTEQRARHLALASVGADRGVAAALVDAARGARSRGAPDIAAELFDQSIRLTEDDADRWPRTIEAAECHFALGDHKEALLLLDFVVRDGPTGPVRAAALRSVGEIHGMAMQFRAAQQALAEALVHAGDEEHLRTEVEVAATLALVALGDFDGALAHIDAARARAEHLGNGGLLAEVLSTQVFTKFLAGEGVDRAAMQRALALDDPTRQRPLAMVPPLVWAVTLFLSGDVDGARPVLEQVRTRLIDRGQHASLPVVLYFLVRSELARGGVAAAQAYVEESRDASANDLHDMAHFVHLQSEAELALHLGDLDTAAAIASELLPEMIERGWLFAVAIQLATLSTVHKLRAEHAEVHTTVGPVVQLVAAMGLREIAHAPFLADEIEALIALGDLDEADRLSALLAERCEALDRPASAAVATRCQALVRAAHGDSEGALRMLDSAVTVLDALPPSLELGRTLLVRGELARRTKRWSTARSSLDSSARVFEQLGARAWRGVAQEQLGRIGGRAATSEALTPTEHSVAELVAHGLTNREVAQRLFLTPKAVEANLTKIYRKVGVRSRAELAAIWSTR